MNTNILSVDEQTLDGLHHRAKYAHLDVTSNNIMLRRGQPHVIEWDLIRLLDLGLAQSCVTGMPGLLQFNQPEQHSHKQSVDTCMLCTAQPTLYVLATMQMRMCPRLGRFALKGVHHCMHPHSSCMPGNSCSHAPGQIVLHLKLAAVTPQPRHNNNAQLPLAKGES